MTTITQTTDDPAPLDRKGTLFCPDCGHESSYDGDWIVHERSGTSPETDRVLVVCPDCATTVEDRPRFDTRDRQCGCKNPAD